MGDTTHRDLGIEPEVRKNARDIRPEDGVTCRELVDEIREKLANETAQFERLQLLERLESLQALNEAEIEELRRIG